MKVVLIFYIFSLVLVYLYFVSKFSSWKVTELEKIRSEYENRINEVKQYYDELTKNLEDSIRKEYNVKFEEWKMRAEKEIRADAIRRSANTIKGKVAEQVAPLELFLENGFNPKDMRFIGSPVDYVIFDGLYDGDLKRIVFVEVKTGVSGLSKRERMIRDVVKDGKVEWIEFRMG